MQVQFSPSLRVIVTVELLTEVDPPLGLVTVQTIPVRFHPAGMGVSFTV